MPSSQTPPAGATALDAQISRTTPDGLREALLALKADGFAMLLDIGGVDYLTREPRYDVVYHLVKFDANGKNAVRARVLCGVPADDTTVPTLTDVWPAADWAEREVFDLFGIRFSGHPDLRRIQLPVEWIGHPLRKDYPLRGPALERTPRPSFALKSNVAAGTPASGKTAAALQRQIAAARGQAVPAVGSAPTTAAQSDSTPGAVPTAGAAAPHELAAEKNAAIGGQLPKDGAK
jgi:NADH/F420H2 dehydrogenase subunit C